MSDDALPSSRATLAPEGAGPPDSHLLRDFWLVAKLDMVESLRARWFALYSTVFGGLVALLFIFGLTEEEVARRKAEGYAPRDVYRSNPDLKRVLDAVAQGAFSPSPR